MDIWAFLITNYFNPVVLCPVHIGFLAPLVCYLVHCGIHAGDPEFIMLNGTILSYSVLAQAILSSIDVLTLVGQST